jgi:hypothetical protein
VTPSALFNKPTEHPMSQSFDASKSLTTLEQDNTVIAVIEMSQSKWLVAAVVPGGQSRSRFFSRYIGIRHTRIGGA